MQTFEITIQYRMVRLGDADPLTKPKSFVDYMTGAFVDCAKDEESLWLISLNPKWRPMGRTLLRTGPLAATMTMPRDLFRVALLTEANAIAVVRGEPSENVTMTKHDEATLRRFRETAECLNIEFVDYLIISTCDDRRWPLFYSWHAAGRP